MLEAVDHGLDREILGERKSLARSVLLELREIAKLGVPLALSSASGNLNMLVSSVLLGRLDTIALAAVIGQLSMFCSQAYGAGNYALVGTWLQIYLVFVTVAGTPFMLLRFLTTPILESFHLHHDVAVTAGVYTIWSQAGFLFDVWYNSIKEYYAAQQITMPAAVVDAIFVFVNFILTYVAVFPLKGGIIGAALAFCTAKLLRTITYILVCWSKGYHKRTWPGWSYKEIFVGERWRRLLAMTIPAAIGGLAEELQFQVCTLMAGEIGPAETAAFNLVMTILILAFLFSMAMGDSVGIRMAKSLGEGRAQRAAFVARLGIIVSVIGGVVIAGFVCVLMPVVVPLMSKDGEAGTDPVVQDQMIRLRWTGTVTIALIGGVLPVVTVLTKQGRTKIVSITLPVCCWFTGFPCSYFLGRAHGLLGICEGLIIGYSLACVFLMIAFVRSDWPQLARDAQRRAEVEQVEQVEQVDVNANEDIFYGDPSWQRPCGFVGALFVFIYPLGLYYSAMLCLITDYCDFARFGKGTLDPCDWLVLSLERPRKLITGILFAHTRNPNYFGEFMTYTGFAVLSMNWVPLGLFTIAWLNLLRAENRKFTNRLCGLQLEVESRSNAFDTFSWVTEAAHTEAARFCRPVALRAYDKAVSLLPVLAVHALLCRKLRPYLQSRWPLLNFLASLLPNPRREFSCKRVLLQHVLELSKATSEVIRCPRSCVGYKAETVVSLGKGRSCVSSKLSVERPLSLLQAPGPLSDVQRRVLAALLPLCCLPYARSILRGQTQDGRHWMSLEQIGSSDCSSLGVRWRPAPCN
eukprot:s321_g6.t1